MKSWPVWLSVVCLSACHDAQPQEAEPGVQVIDTTAPFKLSSVDKVDVLFVVDNSNSMAGEQASLRAQFPRLIQALSRGERFPGDPHPFTPISDIHVGVVSTDMGIAGVNYGACHADGGDDGKLIHMPRAGSGDSCEPDYPLFLSHDSSAADFTKLASDFTCIAAIGTGGCGMEEQLEAPLKALSSSTAEEPKFLSALAAGVHGRGDLPVDMGGNAGFLRDGSLIMIVLLTDEEDCSVSKSEHLWPANILPAGSPYLNEDVNLRCFLHPEFQYDVQKRYLKYFRALRPGRPDLVLFTAIAGVPPDLVDRSVLASTDFDDAAARDAFYDHILNDERMQEVIDPTTMPGMGMGNLTPSCVRSVPGEQALSTAYPPRRIVQLAKAFGPYGIVQSICQDDLAPAVDSIVDVMARPLGSMCVPDGLKHDADGRVDCELYWQLPAASPGSKEPPLDCADLGEIWDRGSDEPGQRCRIRQLAVHDGTPAEGEGWYLSDHASYSARSCPSGSGDYIAYAHEMEPLPGVAVTLECHQAKR